MGKKIVAIGKEPMMEQLKIYLLVVILDDLARLPPLLEAWRAIGLPGATILQSVGSHRAQSWLSQVGLGALDRLFDTDEVRRRTLLMVVEGEDALARAVGEAEQAVGGFDRPNSGLLLVVPVAEVRGIHKIQARQQPESLPPPVRPDWVVRRNTPVDQVLPVLDLEPVMVRPDTPIEEVARVMLGNPRVSVACVVNEEGRLLGLVEQSTLADDLFFRIMPEEFMSEATDLEAVMRFAQKSGLRTAADAMVKPAWVKESETVKDAFKRMHDLKLPGLPVVDDRYRMVGYLSLSELMAASMPGLNEAGTGEAP